MPSYSLMQSAPGPETVIDGVRYLYFAGTSYLGLAAHPEVIEAGCAAMRAFGVHSATSRARFGTNPPVLAVEHQAARFFGAEDAFYFSSGYVSNHIMVPALSADVDYVLVDEAAHYCVLEAARLAGNAVTPFHHRDPEDLADKIRGQRNVLVMADAVVPSTGALAPVEDYLRVLAGCERARLMLDDAHGFGVLGPDGRGLYDELGLWSRVNQGPAETGVSLFVAGTVAKALGGFGGIIPGTRTWLNHVRRASHYFDGASAPASAEAGATARALELVQHQPELRIRLRQNSLRLRQGLARLGLTVPGGFTAQVGVVIGDAANMQRIHEALKTRQIMVPYFNAYSGLPPQGVLRFAVFANHTVSQIDHLLDELRILV